MKEAYWWAGAVVVLIWALALRAALFGVVTSDYTSFLLPWSQHLLNSPGLSAFALPFADYAPTYLYLLKLLAFLPLDTLVAIKILSVFFDVVAALGAVFVVRALAPRRTGAQLFATFVGAFALPTVLINSALWGQSDSVYAAGVVWSLYFILKDKPLPATFALGWALMIKLQAIFFLPVLVGYCLRRKETWWYPALVPAMFLLSALPAAAEGQWMYWLTIYAHQASEYPWLSVSAQSIFAFVQYLPLQPEMIRLLFVGGLLSAGIAAVWTLWRVRTERYVHQTLLVALLCVSMLPYLLPRMHERYFYLADLFAFIYAVVYPRRWFVPAAVVLASFLSYMPFLSPQVALLSALQVDLRVPAVIMGVVIAYLLREWWLRPAQTLQTAGVEQEAERGTPGEIGYRA